MSNPFYNAQPNLMGMVQQLKRNPVQFLMQRKYNIPQNIAQDPNAILNHLLSSGQVNQQMVNSAYQMAQRFK